MVDIFEPYRAKTKGFKTTNIAMFAVGLTTFDSMYSVQALLPVFSKQFHVSPDISALAISLTTGALALSLIPAGALSDKIGRTKIITLSAIASVIIGLLLPFSPNIWVILAGRTLQGICLAGVPAVAMTFIAEEIHSDSLGSAMGTYIAGTSIGGLIGRLLCSTSLDIMSWRYAMLVPAISALIFALICIKYMPKSRFFTPKKIGFKDEINHLWDHIRNPKMMPLFLLGFLLMGGFVTVYNYLGYRLGAEPFNLPESVIGLVFIMYLAGTVSSNMAGRAVDKYSRSKVLLITLVIGLFGLGLSFFNWLPTIIFGTLLFTAGFFASHSVASGWVGASAKQYKAQASSLYLFAYYLGSAFMGWFGGIVYADYHWNGIILYVGIMLLAGMISLFVLTKNQKKLVE